MIRLVLIAAVFQGSIAIADTTGVLAIGVFEGKIAVQLSGYAASEISKLATSSKNISCSNETCRFDFDSNAKAQKPKLNLEEATQKSDYRFALEEVRGDFQLSSYSANGDPTSTPLVKILYNFLAEASEANGSKIKCEAITNHDYACEGSHLRCTSYVSGDYLCEMKVTRSGLTKN